MSAVPSHRRVIPGLLAALCCGALAGAPAASAQAIRLGDRVPLRAGMRGGDVRALQDLLVRVGLTVSVDGEFGPRTARAVRAFERRAARTVDGEVQRGDIRVLRRTAAARPATATVVAPATAAPPAPAAPPLPTATVGPGGLAVAPEGAPDVVKRIIAAANQIATTPYRYGGGHGSWTDSGYDCSGSVSYALHGAGLLSASMPSGGFTSWGDAGAGRWVTIYANAGHMYMVVAGLRFDTSGHSAAGTRWQADMRSSAGFVVRHPAGL